MQSTEIGDLWGLEKVELLKKIFERNEGVIRVSSIYAIINVKQRINIIYNSILQLVNTDTINVVNNTLVNMVAL